MVCTGAVVNMHPNHLWFDSPSNTDMINPFGVCNCDRGWAWPALWSLLFSAHSIVIPLRQDFQQVYPRVRQLNSNRCQILKCRLPTLKSGNDRPPSHKSKPKCSISSRQFYFDWCNFIAQASHEFYPEDHGAEFPKPGQFGLSAS